MLYIIIGLQGILLKQLIAEQFLGNARRETSLQLHRKKAPD